MGVEEGDHIALPLWRNSCIPLSTAVSMSVHSSGNNSPRSNHLQFGVISCEFPMVEDFSSIAWSVAY